MGEQSGGVRVVCFDLGGVIVRICRSWEEACARAGVDVRSASDDAQLLQMRRDAVRAYQSGCINCQEYFQTTARSTGNVYDAHEVSLIHKAWTCEDYPNVEAMVLALGELPGITTACLSNTNHSHWRILSHGDGQAHPASPALAGISKHLASHELGLVKPDRAIYERAQEALGVRAHEIVFFDDLLENVDAAKRCGWRAFAIDHRGDTAAQMIHHLASLDLDVGLG